MMYGISSDTRAQDLPHRHTEYPTYGKSRAPKVKILLVRRSLIDELVDCGEN
jgi:hypothetical protein